MALYFFTLFALSYPHFLGKSHINSQYIPAFLFLPEEIMDCEPIEFRRISRNVQKLLRDPVTISQVESEAFLLGIILGYSLLVWPAMGMKCT